MSDDLLSPHRRVSEAEDAKMIADAILAGGAGRLSRAGDVFLAGATADVVADRLALADYVAIKRGDRQ